MDEFVMANKCLELCQALASHGQKFSFSLNIGSNFSFSLDTREKPTSRDTSKVDTLQKGMKKKLSPSQVRRNLKRKEDYLRKKSKNSMTVQSQPYKKAFMCDQCENVFKTENNLNIHMDKTHDGKESFENIEQLDGHVSLPLDSSTNRSD